MMNRKDRRYNVADRLFGSDDTTNESKPKRRPAGPCPFYSVPCEYVPMAHQTAALEAENERLREELDTWKSVFPDIAPQNVMPDRSLVEQENERLRAALVAWDDAVKIYPTMEGPRYGGMSSELAKKAWALTRAVLDGRPVTGKGEA